jgi:hypothetical protein
MKMLDRTIRHQQAMLAVKGSSPLRCTFENLSELTFVDVEVDPNPVEDGSVNRSKGLRATEEPAVVAVSVTNPNTYLARAAGPAVRPGEW